jgi:hypothetical protein
MSVRAKLGSGAAEAALPDVSALHGTAAGARPRSVVRERHGHRDYVIRRVLAAGDVCGVVLAFAVAAALDPAHGANLDVVAWGLVTIPPWVVLFKMYGLYDRDLKRPWTTCRGSSTRS